MALKQVFHRVRQNLKYCDFHKCNFFTWDDENDKIVAKKSTREQCLVFLSIGIHGLYVLLQIIAIIKAPKSSLIDAVEAIGIPITLLAALFLRFDLQIDTVPLQLLNYIYGLKDTKKFSKGQKFFLAFINHSIVLLEALYWIVPAFMALLTGFLPCKIPFLSSLFICKNEKCYSWMTRLSVILLEFILWQQFAVSGAYYTIIMVVALSFFWVEVDTHCSQTRLDFSSYRKLQILEKVINSFNQTRLLPIFAWMIPIMQIVLLYVVIKLGQSSDSEIVKVVVFTMMYFDLIILTIGIYSAAAKVHNLSKEWIKGAKQGCKNKLERKIQKCLIPLRLYFANNFVDTLTPFVIQDFCLRSTASLLLLGKK